MKVHLRRLADRVPEYVHRPISARSAYIAAGLIGLVTYLVVFGPGHLFGTNEYWKMPSDDERMSLIGYRYFLNEPWHWPLFESHAVDAPFPKSVALLDCIPIWALANKAIATVVPPWKSFSSHAYLGLWHALAYVLQPCLGLACLRRLGHRNLKATIISSLFLLAIPAWIFRYGHAALSAHWIELWALYLYLQTPSAAPGPARLGIAKLGQLTFASLVSPYHPVMSFGIFFASLLRSRHVRTIAIWSALGILSVALPMWIAGYFGHATNVHQWGFEVESTNLLSWLVPVRSGFLGDGQWIAQVMATEWQWEGYCYLGVGYLLLVGVLLTRVRQVAGILRRHTGLFVICTLFAIFALSNHIYFGGHEVASYSIPRFLHRIPDQFRSPGRFVWVPLYVLTILLLHAALTRSRRGPSFAILVVALMLQLIDASGDWAFQRAWTAGRRSDFFLEPAWRDLVRVHHSISVQPTFSCLDESQSPEDVSVSTEIEMLASETASPINGTYDARPTRDCRAEQRGWATLVAQPDTLYVLLRQGTAVSDLLQANGASCGVFKQGRMCSANKGAIEEAIKAGILQPPAPAIDLRVGATLELAKAEQLNDNWSLANRGGQWTVGALSSIPLHLVGEPRSSVTLRLKASALLCGKRDVQDVDVFIDGVLTGTLHFDRASNDPEQIREIRMPSHGTLHNLLALEFAPHDTRIPSRLECGDESRRLGILVSQIWLE